MTFWSVLIGWWLTSRTAELSLSPTTDFSMLPNALSLRQGMFFFNLLISGGKLPLPEQKRLFLISISNLGALVASEPHRRTRTWGRSIVSWLKPTQDTLGFESIRQVNMSETELIGCVISQNAAWQYAAALHRFTGLDSCLWISKIHSEPSPALSLVLRTQGTRKRVVQQLKSFSAKIQPSCPAV